MGARPTMIDNVILVLTVVPFVANRSYLRSMENNRYMAKI